MTDAEFFDFERRGWEDLGGAYTGIDGVTAACAQPLLDAAGATAPCDDGGRWQVPIPAFVVSAIKP